MASKRKRGGFDPSYLAELSQNTDTANIFGEEIGEKHQELQRELKAVDPSTLPYLPIAALHDNPYQSRRSMDESELQKLTAEIRERGFQGVLAARPHPTEPEAYQIVSGHRRKRAAELAGLESLPVLVKSYSDEEMLFLQATENLLRESLTPLDEANMFHAMQEMGYTQVEIAEKVRQSRGYVRNRLELLKAPPAVQEMVRQDRETVRAAYYLKDIDDEQLLTQLIQAILNKQITGESVPGYLAALKEEQARQETAAASSSSDVDEVAHVAQPSSENGHGAQPLSAEAMELTPLSRGSHYSSEQGRAPQPASEQGRAPQPASGTATAVSPSGLTSQGSSVADRVMEAGGKKSKELLEAGKLRTVLNQLQGYQNRLVKRQASPSEEESELLNAIETLCHTLQEM